MANVEIQSNIKLGLQEILDGIAKLETNDIEIFLKEVTHILAQKKQQQPSSNKETQLLKKIKKAYPIQFTIFIGIGSIKKSITR